MLCKASKMFGKGKSSPTLSSPWVEVGPEDVDRGILQIKMASGEVLRWRKTCQSHFFPRLDWGKNGIGWGCGPSWSVQKFGMGDTD